MNANVHTSVGLATTTGVALLVPAMQCENPLEYSLCLGCAVIGALIPDIDANGESKAKKEFRKIMSYLILASVAIIGLSYMNGTLIDLLKSFTSSIRGIGLIAFIVCCIIGYKSDHRKFTHYLIGLICFTVPFIMMTDLRLGLWFGVGMLSHQVIDMLNKRKIQWLYPLPFDFARYICKASSTLSSVIGVASTGLACIFGYLLIF